MGANKKFTLYQEDDQLILIVNYFFLKTILITYGKQNKN
jgi:hypothetical protein